ncbi:nucleotide-binding alpha-beta plait domain-containing protein [Tanacetum coccineum]
MGIFRTKEDDVAKISTSIYVSNFPEVFSAKDLFHACKKYGHVIDSFIPFKKSKDGKRFGFVRFINVFNTERLVSNLCTIWVGRSKFHANVARFHRTPVKINKASKDNVYEPKRKSNVNENGSSNAGKSYAHVLKTHNSFEALDCESAPSIVLDDDCLNSRDLSKTLLGRVKEFASLSNLKVVLKNEGFDEIKLQYMGELWVLLEFPSSKIKELFQENRGVGSWFSVLKQTSTEFVPEGRILWVEIEGVPFKLWSKNTFKKIASKWGEILDTEDQEEDGFYTKRLCIYSKLGNNIYENFKVIFRGKVFVLRAKEIPGWVPEFADEFDDDDESEEGSKGDTANSHGAFNFDDADDVDKVPETELDDPLEQNENPSEDPFGIYSILKKNKDNDASIPVSDHSIKFPPGFTPNGVSMQEDIGRSVNDVTSPRIVEKEQNEQERINNYNGSKDEMSGSVCSGIFKKPVAPQSGGSILCVLEELVKVGQAMGYNMKGCVNNISEIIESQGVSGVNR